MRNIYEEQRSEKQQRINAAAGFSYNASQLRFWLWEPTTATLRQQLELVFDSTTLGGGV